MERENRISVRDLLVQKIKIVHRLVAINSGVFKEFATITHKNASNLKLIKLILLNAKAYFAIQIKNVTI
jgi:hypothetical protein